MKKVIFFPVTQGQKLVACGNRALLEHSPLWASSFFSLAKKIWHGVHHERTLNTDWEIFEIMQDRYTVREFFQEEL